MAQSTTTIDVTDTAANSGAQYHVGPWPANAMLTRCEIKCTVAYTATGIAANVIYAIQNGSYFGLQWTLSGGTPNTIPATTTWDNGRWMHIERIDLGAQQAFQDTAAANAVSPLGQIDYTWNGQLATATALDLYFTSGVYNITPAPTWRLFGTVRAYFA